jgi:hypothetical protein
MNDFIIKKS